MAGAFTGFGELTLVTRDGSGPNGQQGGFYPFISSFSLTRTADITDKYGYKPVGGSGIRQKLASYQIQADWEGSFTMPVASFLDLQLVMGQKAKTATQSYLDVKSGVVTSGIITDAGLSGISNDAIVVTWGGYNSTAGGPVQLQITTTTPTATTVDLDNSANTLTFHSNYEGQEIYYTIRKSASKKVIGLGNPTVYGSLEFYGQVSTSGTSTAAGYGIYIPELTLDGSVSLSVTGDDEIEVPFSPVISGTNSEAVLLIEL